MDTQAARKPDGRVNNGGKRVGAGAKPLSDQRKKERFTFRSTDAEQALVETVAQKLKVSQNEALLQSVAYMAQIPPTTEQKEYRCPHCEKLLFTAGIDRAIIQIQCPRCKEKTIHGN